MAYGLKVRNIRSEYQIDSQYINYELAEENLNVSASAGAESTFTFATVVKNPPVILLRPINYGISLRRLIHDGTNYTGWIGVGTITTGSTFDWRLYTATINSTDSGKYGLRIKNERGETVFENSDCFKIRQIIDASIGSTYSHSSYNNPWYIQTPQQSRILRVPTGGGLGYQEGFFGSLIYSSATQITYNWRMVYHAAPIPVPSGSDINTGTTCQIVVCEV